MRHPVLVLLTSAVLLLAFGTGSALADTPAVQSADQSASTTQSAASSADAEQTDPSNSVVDIRIGSPGDNGAIEQSNSNTAGSTAGNDAATSQSSGQTSGGSGVQAALQHADTLQSTSSSAKAVQVDPTNDAVTIRIHSDGKDGPVKQSNDNSAKSDAGNTAGTEQTAGQSSGGGGGGGVQDAEQSATTDQSAKAGALAKQDHPSNEVVRIRIHSAGGNGDVKQSNSNRADSTAGNEASTVQGAEQSQGGSGTQYASQAAGTEQSASSKAEADQDHPSNSVESVRLHSPGDDGAIKQSNDNKASSSAGNSAGTGQTVSQGSGSGHGVQASDQMADTGQGADSTAKAEQDDPYNSAGGVLIDSDSSGGDIDQSNANAADSDAGNAAETTQYALQDQSGTPKRDERSTCCSDGKDGKDGKAVQAAGQSASTKQVAKSDADALQSGATNEAGGVRKDSDGTDGAVTQSNDNSASSSAGNKAGTMQWLEQSVGGLHSKLGVQAAGQDAATDQGAVSKGVAHQDTPCNLFEPVRLSSKGGYGSVGQRNDNKGKSDAGSAGATLQQLWQLL